MQLRQPKNVVDVTQEFLLCRCYVPFLVACSSLSAFRLGLGHMNTFLSPTPRLQQSDYNGVCVCVCVCVENKIITLRTKVKCSACGRITMVSDVYSISSHSGAW